MTAITRFDLNADLGESFGAYSVGNDEEVLRLVSSANVACGFHAGDPSVMMRTIEAAAQRGIRVGAHPGYRDLAGFGRRAIAYSYEELKADLIYQISAAWGMAQAVGVTLSYVKPHGALYNTMVRDRVQATAVIDAILAVDPGLKLMALAGAPVLEWARAEGLGTIAEAFADRAYLPDGTLAPRSQPGAVLHDPEAVAAQALSIARSQSVGLFAGGSIEVSAQSLCVHGDNPEALANVTAIVALFAENGIAVGA